MTLYPLFLFLFSGMFGWVIDTFDRSIERKRFREGSALHIPFLPIYGFGGLLLFYIRPLLPHNIFAQGLLLGLMLASLEYVGGVFSVLVFHRRLWEYKTKFNLNGHTDLAHAIMWGCLGLVFLHWIEPVLWELITQWA